MKTRPTFGCIATLAMFAGFQPSAAAAQDARSDRFGLGPAVITGNLASYDGGFVGGEGFIRVARGAFWSVRLDGAYLVPAPTADKVSIASSANQGYDTRTIGQVGTLVATAIFGPSSPNGLRPVYGLVGFGGAATRWGGGYFQPSSNSGGQGAAGVGAGPSFALAELGVGSEFRGIFNDRIELRAFRSVPTPPTGNQAILGGIGASLTFGVVW